MPTREVPSPVRPLARTLQGRLLAAAALALGLVAVQVAAALTAAVARRASNTRRSRINAVADTLASVTAQRAAAAGATFLDARGAYAGHEVCSASPWLNGTTLPITDSYHPNRSGYALAYLPLLRSTAT